MLAFGFLSAGASLISRASSSNTAGAPPPSIAPTEREVVRGVGVAVGELGVVVGAEHQDRALLRVGAVDLRVEVADRLLLRTSCTTSCRSGSSPSFFTSSQVVGFALARLSDPNGRGPIFTSASTWPSRGSPSTGPDGPPHAANGRQHGVERQRGAAVAERAQEAGVHAAQGSRDGQNVHGRRVGSADTMGTDRSSTFLVRRRQRGAGMSDFDLPRLIRDSQGSLKHRTRTSTGRARSRTTWTSSRTARWSIRTAHQRRLRHGAQLRRRGDRGRQEPKVPYYTFFSDPIEDGKDGIFGLERSLHGPDGDVQGRRPRLRPGAPRAERGAAAAAAGGRAATRSSPTLQKKAAHRPTSCGSTSTCRRCRATTRRLLLKRYDGDYAKVLDHVKVRRMLISREGPRRHRHVPAEGREEPGLDRADRRHQLPQDRRARHRLRPARVQLRRRVLRRQPRHHRVHRGAQARRRVPLRPADGEPGAQDQAEEVRPDRHRRGDHRAHQRARVQAAEQRADGGVPRPHHQDRHPVQPAAANEIKIYEKDFNKKKVPASTSRRTRSRSRRCGRADAARGAQEGQPLAAAEAEALQRQDLPGFTRTTSRSCARRPSARAWTASRRATSRTRSPTRWSRHAVHQPVHGDERARGGPRAPLADLSEETQEALQGRAARGAEEYEDIVKNEVQRAISADEEAIARLCGNYIDNVKAYTRTRRSRTRTPARTRSRTSG